MDRTVGVIGTFVWDTIRHPGRSEGEPLEQWGGIAYSLAALAAACPPNWRIRPMVKVGFDLADEAFRFLDLLPNLDSRPGLQIVPQANNRVELRYRDSAERTERLSGGVTPWCAEELLPLLEGLDALFVNFISGFELDLATAQWLREQTKIPIYADLHSLFLGAPGEGPREPRPLQEWEEWFGCFDLVQLNESEVGLTGFDEAARVGAFPMGLRPRAVLVTRGGAGAVAYHRSSFRTLVEEDPLQVEDARERFDRTSHPLLREPLAGDPTGCGDVWGGVVFAGLLENRPLAESISRGHRAAAAKMQVSGIDHLFVAVAAALSPPDFEP